MSALKRLIEFSARHVLKRPNLAKRIAFYMPDWVTALRTLLNEVFYQLKLTRGYAVTAVVVELSSVCNLDCIICARHKVMTREQGHMDLVLFKRLVDANTSVRNYILVGWGEMMLNPIFFDAVDYLKSKGKRVALTSNATLFTPDNCERIVMSGISHITISMDGIDKVYQSIRGFPFETIEANITTLSETIRRHGADVYVEINSVALPAVLSQKDDITRRIGPFVDDIRYSSYLEYNKLKKNNRKNPCRELWRGMITVLYDGRVVPCCMDYNATMDLGHISESSLDELWNNELAISMRSEQLQRKFLRRCATCFEVNPCKNAEIDKRFD
jgi:radical SAM protein with 4Fe4S-binding SPASM domain